MTQNVIDLLRSRHVHDTHVSLTKLPNDCVHVSEIERRHSNTHINRKIKNNHYYYMVTAEHVKLLIPPLRLGHPINSTTCYLYLLSTFNLMFDNNLIKMMMTAIS